MGTPQWEPRPTTNGNRACQVWIAIDRKARLPRIDSLPLKIVRFSGEALTQGVANLKGRWSASSRLQPDENRRRLFQVPQQDRDGIRGGGASIQHSPGEVQPLPSAPLCANLRVEKLIRGY